MDIGIVSYGLYTPETFETAEGLSAKSGLSPEEVKELGIKRKCLPSGEDQPVTMAVKAANQALERAGDVAPEDVDLVIWTGEEYKDYIAQTASIRLQEETGCKNAWAFDLVGQNVTSIQGLRVARDFILGDETIHTILLAGGTRNIDLVDPENPDTRFLLASSASGGAMILRRNHGANRLIQTAFTIDHEMADEVYVPGGGTEIPFAPDNLDSKIMFYQTPRPRVVKDYLAERWVPALAETAQKVLKGLSPDYVALRHLGSGERMEVLNALKIKPERSAALDNWGCHGTNDVLLSLDLGLKSGAVTEKSLVVFLSGGIGFTYAAALIQWGEC
ncbi:MAG: 3-oxoacyl-[acyl-carrier-protein] synthase III C-terminal domain-containing protein [Gammaproteobacteria bacterium]